MNPHLCILGSSGGSAFAAAYEILLTCGKLPRVTVLVDRECGLKTWAAQKCLDVQMIPWISADDFCGQAARFCQSINVDYILLFYTRLLKEPLIGLFPIFNIHPSILPAFPGMGAEQNMVDHGVRVIGATLHLVDDRIDSGPILAQTASGFPCGADLQLLRRMEYVFKVYLTLLLIDLLHHSLPRMLSPLKFESLPDSLMSTPCASPALLSQDLLSAYRGWMAMECPGIGLHV